uniref:Uncharacterized protein n=1 Tax=Rhizophora mucronata TaxID=61149 RepID=A0A2P2Q8C6_RHIMU
MHKYSTILVISTNHSHIRFQLFKRSINIQSKIL